MSTLIYYAIPAFILTVALEWVYARKLVREGASVRGYETKDTFASLTMGVGNVLIAGVVKIGVIALWLFLYEHRIFDLPIDAWWVWLLLFVFVYWV